MESHLFFYSVALSFDSIPLYELVDSASEAAAASESASRDEPPFEALRPLPLNEIALNMRANKVFRITTTVVKIAYVREILRVVFFRTFLHSYYCPHSGPGSPDVEL